MVYVKENINDFIDFLEELDIINYTCHQQKKYLITINIGGRGGKEYHTIEAIIAYDDEQRKLNRILRKLTMEV